MTRYGFRAEVRARPGVADPAGLAVERALPALGFAGVGEVSVGKAIRFVVEADGPEEARATAEQLCQRLLANPVIERFELAALAEERQTAPDPGDGAPEASPGSGRGGRDGGLAGPAGETPGADGRP